MTLLALTPNDAPTVVSSRLARRASLGSVVVWSSARCACTSNSRSTDARVRVHVPTAALGTLAAVASALLSHAVASPIWTV